MSSLIDSLESAQLRRAPAFDAGDRVRVHFQVVEGTRRRTQVYEGVVIKRQGHGVRETFTVRKQSFGVGVERTFPLHSPKIERIEVAARGDVRRAKLYYLRERVGKRARVRERRDVGPEQAVERELLNRVDAQVEEIEALDESAQAAEPGGAGAEAAEPEVAESDAPAEGGAVEESAESDAAGEAAGDVSEPAVAGEAAAVPEAEEASEEPEGEAAADEESPTEPADQESAPSAEDEADAAEPSPEAESPETPDS